MAGGKSLLASETVLQDLSANYMYVCGVVWQLLTVRGMLVLFLFRSQYSLSLLQCKMKIIVICPLIALPISLKPLAPPKKQQKTKTGDPRATRAPKHKTSLTTIQARGATVCGEEGGGGRSGGWGW